MTPDSTKLISAVAAPASRLYRHHSEACPFRELGVRHTNCNCSVFIDFYRNGKRLQCALRTHNWGHAEWMQRAIEKGSPLEVVVGISVPRLTRRHKQACSLRSLGRGHIDCECPIYVDDFKDAKGKWIKHLNIKTTDWQFAEERLQRAVESGKLQETIRAMRSIRLFRTHRMACPLREHGWSRGDCECPIHIQMDGWKDANGKRVQHQSLGTNDWQEARAFQKEIENGVPAEAILTRPTLYRHHGKECPFRELGVRHKTCPCPVYVDRGYVDGKRIRRTMKTNDWEYAARRLKAERGTAVVRAKRGRRPDAVALKLFARWVGIGKPKVTAVIGDQLAKEFYPNEYSVVPIRKTRKKLRARVWATIFRLSR